MDAVAYLYGKSLLDLKPPGISLYDTGELAEAGNLSVRDICDMAFANERKHVVLAHREEFDVLHNDHLLVFFVKNRRFDNLFPVLAIPLGEKLEGLGHS